MKHPTRIVAMILAVAGAVACLPQLVGAFTPAGNTRLGKSALKKNTGPDNVALRDSLGRVEAAVQRLTDDAAPGAVRVAAH